MLDKKIKQFKKALKIKDAIIGIGFAKYLPSGYRFYRDTACTALARSIAKKERVIFGTKKFPQLCPGANYFLRLSEVKNSKTCNVYVKEEQVFANKEICKIFLKNLPKFPNTLKNKFVIVKPFESKDNPQVIILLINPAQAGRVLGLLNYDQYKKIEIYPNQPTCLSFFTPLVTKKTHINFIDYYDRY